MSRPISHVVIDMYLDEIEKAATRLTTGNVSHDGPMIRALVQALRRRLDLKRNKVQQEGER